MSEAIDEARPSLTTPAVEADTTAALERALGKLAEVEARVSERLYEIYFARRPDVQPLFGAYAIAEREEMVRETLRCLLATATREAWLPGNLEALGRSHAEYGVTSDMYAPFVESLIECARESVVESLSGDEEAALRSGLEHVTRQMRQAGESASKAESA